MFYLCINIGSLSSIATTTIEKATGFWTAFLPCLVMFCIGIVVLIAGKKFYVVRPPKGSVLIQAFHALWIGLVYGGNMGELNATLLPIRRLLTSTETEAAKPSYQDEHGRKHRTPWSDLFVEELRRGLVACRVFVFYPVYWLVYSQMLNNFISQGVKSLQGLPADASLFFISGYDAAPWDPQ